MSFDSNDLHAADQADKDQAHNVQAYNDQAAGTNAVASLQARHPFSLLLAEDDRARAAELDSIIDAIADTQTRFARATNPLRARLTLERLLIQVVRGGPESTQGDEPSLIRRIAERRGAETRVILMIEQAETLHPEVMRFLARTSHLFPDDTPRLQILFVGRPSFRTMMDDPDAGFDEHTAQFEAYRPVDDPPANLPSPDIYAATLPQRGHPFESVSLRSELAAVWKKGWLTQLGIIVGTLGGTAAVALALMLALTKHEVIVPVDTSSALLEMPEPADEEPEPPVLQHGPITDPATLQLKREFDAYLTASGRDIDNATAGQRRAIYQEFLAWRARTAGPARPPAPGQ